jgi:hypothetical protein
MPTAVEGMPPPFPGSWRDLAGELTADQRAGLAKLEAAGFNPGQLLVAARDSAAKHRPAPDSASRPGLCPRCATDYWVAWHVLSRLVQLLAPPPPPLLPLGGRGSGSGPPSVGLLLTPPPPGPSTPVRPPPPWWGWG